MIEHVKAPLTHLYTRRCVCCGHDAPTLQQNRTTHCEQCGCDLRDRPPRSYAEMEGLLWQRRPAPRPLREYDFERHRLLRRWMAIVFLFFMVLMSIVYFAAALMV